MKRPDLNKRIVSGTAVTLFCLIPFLLGGWWFAALAALIGLLMAREWVRMSDRFPTFAAYFLIFFALVGSLILGMLDYWYSAIILAVICGLLAVIERARRSKRIWAGFGLVYIVAPCLAFVWLRQSGPDLSGWGPLNDHGFVKVFYIAVVVAFVDMSAYFVGSTFGGPKLMPKLSPNKTWSGFFGGLLGGIVIGALWFSLYRMNPLLGALYALPLGLLAVAGDACESALKRHLKVKDTGGILPGHGGVLDRVDSYVLAAIFSAVILYIKPDIWPAVL